MDKYPICYDTDEMDAYEAFIEENFGPMRDGTIAHELSSEYVHSDVQVFTSDWCDGDCMYVTMGMGARDQISPLMEYKRIELMIFSSEKNKKDIDAINQLVGLSKFPFRNNTWLGPWHTIDAMDSFKEKFGFGAFLFLPEIYGEYITSDGDTVKLLPLLPLYTEEREVLMLCNEESKSLKEKLIDKIAEGEISFRIDDKRECLV